MGKQDKRYHLRPLLATSAKAPVFVLQGEFKVTERPVFMKELLAALDAGSVLEVFGAGTACVVCPVGSLLYQGQVSPASANHIHRRQELSFDVLTSLPVRC